MDARQGDFCTRDVQVRAVREDAREIDFVFSTDRIDRYGESVEQSWRLEDYLANPVVLFAHDSRALPIGKSTSVGVLDGKLCGTVVLATAKANPLAEQVFQLHREGMLKTGSVGFIPHELRYEMRDGREIVVLADNELVEFSITPTPANPDALARHKELAMAKRKSAPEPVAEPVAVEPVAEPEIIAEPVVEEVKDEPAPEPQPETVPDPEPVALAAPKASKPAPVSETPVADAVAAGMASLREQCTALQAQCSALSSQCVAPEAARAEQQARADAHAKELCSRDLNSLVGTKLTAAEVPGMVELFAANRDLYNKQLVAISARPSMVLRNATSTIGSVPVPQPSTTTDSGEALQRRVQARMGR